SQLPIKQAPMFQSSNSTLEGGFTHLHSPGNSVRLGTATTREKEAGRTGGRGMDRSTGRVVRTKSKNIPHSGTEVIHIAIYFFQKKNLEPTCLARTNQNKGSFLISDPVVGIQSLDNTRTGASISL
uniref:Uncharacterized protein n=1 Tax=Amphiprion ocellaris TaxID=80972 RepID=A0AAQ5ZRX5_AMPOC